MSNIIGLIFLVLIATNIVTRSSSWLDTETDIDFRKAVQIKPLTIAIFYDSSSCGFCKKFAFSMYDELLDDELFREHKVGFVRADIAKSHDIKHKYGLDKKSHLMLIVKGHKMEMENFYETQVLVLEQKMANNELYEKVKSFLNEKILGISKEIETIEELTRLVKDKGIALAYVGEKNVNYKLYHRIAKKNADEKLYHIFNPEIKQKLSNIYNVKNLPSNDYIAVIKDTSQITAYDTDRIVTLEVNNNIIAIERFIEFERYPKFRGPEYSEINVKHIMKFGQQMLLYVRSLPLNLYNNSQFNDAIKKLPKRFIFSNVEYKSKDNEVYKELFDKADVKQEPESLYFIYKTPTKKFKIEQYKGNMESNKIVNFVFNFFKEKGHIFGGEHHEYMKEHFNAYNDGNGKNAETGEF